MHRIDSEVIDNGNTHPQADAADLELHSSSLSLNQAPNCNNEHVIKIDLPAAEALNRSEVPLPKIPNKLLKASKILAKHLKETYKTMGNIHADYRTAASKAATLGKRARDKRAEYRANKKTPRAKQLISEYHKLREEARTYYQERDELKAILDTFPIKPNGKTSSFENFSKAAKNHIATLKVSGNWKFKFNAHEERDVIVLAALYSVTFTRNRNGFLTTLPDSLIGVDNEEAEQRTALIARCFFTELNQLSTAYDLEQMKNWTAKLRRFKLGKLIPFQASEVVELAYPGYQAGEEPRIREWFLPASNKWTPGSDNHDEAFRRTVHACRSALRTIGIITPEGNVDTEKLVSTNLGQELHKACYGLRGMQAGPYVKSSLDILELALPGVIGTGNEQVPAWKFRFIGKWEGDAAIEHVDQITRYIVEKKLKLCNIDGTLNPKKTRAVTDWAAQYNEETVNCLRQANIKNAYQALSRCYPESFGWDEDKIQPGDIRYSGMWNGKEGQQLFKLRFAWSLYRCCASLDLQDVRFSEHAACPLIISRNDFLTLRRHLNANTISWLDVFRAANLTAGFSTAAKNNIETAFTILFGKPKGKEEKVYPGTDIKESDVKSRKLQNHKLIAEALQELHGSEHITPLRFVTLNAEKNVGEASSIRGTCLESLLQHMPPTKFRERAKVLYDAFAVSVMPSATNDTCLQGKDRLTALQKIVEAREENGEPVLNNHRLKILFGVFRDTIFPELNLDEHAEGKLSSFLDKLFASSKIDSRQILLEALTLMEVSLKEHTTISYTNHVIEFVFEKMLCVELRHLKQQGRFSTNYERRYQKISCIEDVQEDEVVDIDMSQPSESSNETSQNKTKELKSRKSEKWYDETVQVANGFKDERASFITGISRMSRDRKFWQKCFHEFSAPNIIEEMDLARQIAARLKLRAGNRLDYRTLRGKILPSNFITSIVETDEHGEEDITLSRIDSDIFSHLPPGWPAQIALPLLYTGGVVHVAVASQEALQDLKLYLKTAPPFKAECYPLTEHNWSKLYTFAKRHIGYQTSDADEFEQFLFIGREEVAALYTTLSHLRRDLFRVQKKSKKGTKPMTTDLVH